MTQAQFLVLNSFYLRFSPLVLHFYSPIPPLSVKFLPSKVLLSLCLLQIDTEPAVYEVRLVCKFFANSCQHYIIQWLCELQLKQSSHLLLPTLHAFSSLHICAVYIPHNRWKKNTNLQRVTFSFGVYWKSLHYFFHSTYQGMSIAVAFIFINYEQDPYQTDRTLINIKIISYIVMTNFYLNCFLWVIKIALWM